MVFCGTTLLVIKLIYSSLVLVIVFAGLAIAAPGLYSIWYFFWHERETGEAAGEHSNEPNDAN